MVKITKEAALHYHAMGKPGKIEIVPTKPYRTQTDLSLAYSPVWLSHALRFRKIRTTFIAIPTKVTSLP